MTWTSYLTAFCLALVAALTALLLLNHQSVVHDTASTAAPSTASTAVHDPSSTAAPPPSTASTATHDTASTAAVPSAASASVADTTASYAAEHYTTSSSSSSTSTTTSAPSNTVFYAAPTPPIPYTANGVSMEPVKTASSILTGSPCDHLGCLAHYDDWLYDVSFTSSDRQVVLTLWSKETLVVRSSSSSSGDGGREWRIALGCYPYGVAELPGGRVAVTCPETPEVLVVSLVEAASSERQIQRIPTEKDYFRVAVHPVDHTLIVSRWTEPVIDVISLEGRVLRTLADTDLLLFQQRNSGSITSLTVDDSSGHVLVTVADSSRLYGVPLTNFSSSFSSSSSSFSAQTIETLSGDFPSRPADTAVDGAGNVFVVLLDGSVLVRTSRGRYRQLWAGRGDGLKYEWCYLAHQGDRLLLATVSPRSTDLAAYQLLAQAELRR